MAASEHPVDYVTERAAVSKTPSFDTPSSPDTPASEACGEPFRLAAATWLRELSDWTDCLASPGLACAWADAIIETWLAYEAADGLHADEPLLIVDLAPGSGRLAKGVISRMRARLAALGKRSWRVRYIALPNAATVLTEWDPPMTATLHEQLSDDPWFECATSWPSADVTSNPWIALSAGGFGRHVPHAYAVHYGNFFEAIVRQPADIDEPLSYEWRRTDAPEFYAGLMRRYAGRLASAPVLIAEETVAEIDRLEASARGGYLLLAVDYGVHCERQLRERGLEPPRRAPSGDERLRVNFDAVTWRQKQYGARIRNIQLHDNGWVVHIGLRDSRGTLAHAEPLINALATELAAAHPECIAPDANLIGRVHRSRFDPGVFSTYLAELNEPGCAIDPASAVAWRDVCRKVWDQTATLQLTREFLLGFAAFAQRVGAHSVARAALWARVGEEHDDVDAWCEMTESYLATGRQTQAVHTLSIAVQLAPDDARCVELVDRLSTRRAAWPPVCDAALATADELAIEPLAAYHAESILTQLRDPEIGVTTGLPKLDSLDAVHHWIETDGQCNERRLVFAVLHRDRGFAGVVGAHVRDHAAHFYFWVGADHQGAGIGRAAARLLFLQLESAGVTEIFTVVYADNRRSRRALVSLGFRRIRVTAVMPGAEVLLYRRAERSDEHRDAIAERYHTLGDEIGSTVRFAIGASEAGIKSEGEA
jgi:RimJ/RimL family protein N-acetyltransferase